MKPKFTVKEWFALLEPEVRALALANLENPICQHPAYKPDLKVENLAQAINRAFTWRYTDQGQQYWSDQTDAARKNKRRPPVFTGIDCTVPE